MHSSPLKAATSPYTSSRQEGWDRDARGAAGAADSIYRTATPATATHTPAHTRTHTPTYTHTPTPPTHTHAWTGAFAEGILEIGVGAVGAVGSPPLCDSVLLCPLSDPVMQVCTYAILNTTHIKPTQCIV
jgi:hypothetical protein